MDPRTVIGQLMDTVTHEFFATFDVELMTVVPPLSDGDQLAAVLGYSGADIRGAMGVVADNSLLKATRSAIIPGTPNDEEIEDWAGEISNQLLGRLKNALLRYDQPISLATPMILSGLRLKIAGSKSPPIVLAYTTSNGNLWIWLDVRHNQDLQLVESVVPQEVGIDEGELMFF